MTIEQANRTADNILSLVHSRRREDALRALHTAVVTRMPDQEHWICATCLTPYPCETIEILDMERIPFPDES